MDAVIWDFGGTLVDTYPDVDRALATAIDPAAEAALLDEVAQLTRISSSHAIGTLAARHGVPERRLRTAYEATKAHWREHPPPVMAGAREMLELVRTGGGANLVATHRDRDSATALLRALDLRVADVVCAPDGFARKPDPEMLETLLRRHHLDPDRCLAVGDRTGDVEAATAARVHAVLLRTPGVPLESGQATVIDRLEALRPLVTGGAAD